MTTTTTLTGESGSNGVRANLTPPRRPRTVVENKAFAAFAGRILRAFARRVANGDVEALADLLAFGRQIDQATREAVDGLRGFGYSWSEIGSRAGITKQTAQERWGTAREPKPSLNALPCNANGTVQTSLLDLVPAGGEA